MSRTRAGEAPVVALCTPCAGLGMLARLGTSGVFIAAVLAPVQSLNWVHACDEHAVFCVG